jgi:hypothetical protein
MENLTCKRTVNTPELSFGTDGNFRMAGVSVPENSLRFYEPVFTWLTEFFKTNPQTVNIDLLLHYLNTSSTRALIDILVKVKEEAPAHCLIKVVWYYEEGDEDMLEFGNELQILCKLPLQFVEIEQQDDAADEY